MVDAPSVPEYAEIAVLTPLMATHPSNRPMANPEQAAAFRAYSAAGASASKSELAFATWLP